MSPQVAAHAGSTSIVGATGAIRRSSARKVDGQLDTTTLVLPDRWRTAYRAALSLLATDQPYNDPQDPVARARAQRLRTDTRRWIDEQKRLAAAGRLTPIQALFMAQIPDNWREIDMRRRRRSRTYRK